jgi:hypothetical protein
MVALRSRQDTRVGDVELEIVSRSGRQYGRAGLIRLLCQELYRGLVARDRRLS